MVVVLPVQFLGKAEFVDLDWLHSSQENIPDYYSSRKMIPLSEGNFWKQ